jgi:hypothetical protein
LKVLLAISAERGGLSPNCRAAYRQLRIPVGGLQSGVREDCLSVRAVRSYGRTGVARA